MVVAGDTVSGGAVDTLVGVVQPLVQGIIASHVHRTVLLLTHYDGCCTERNVRGGGCR